MDRLELIVLNNLCTNDNFVKTALPYIIPEYFTGKAEAIIFDLISGFYMKYGLRPSLDAISIMLDERKDTSQQILEEIQMYFDQLFEPDLANDLEWLLDQTEKWCQKRAIYLALRESIAIHDGSRTDMSVDAIPEILNTALAVGFDNHIGHDYHEDWEQRFEIYTNPESKIPFDIDLLNHVTKGGIPEKTLNVCLASTGVGKSLFLCNLSSHYMTLGYNVLYITMEMAEDQIAKRIDANLMDISLDDFATLSKPIFQGHIQKIRQKARGNLIVKQFGTGAGHAGHFRALIQELKSKKDFIPDVVVVDYINICASQRIKQSGQSGSYTIVKAIAEELRAIAIELNVRVISATQTTRNGHENTDVELDDTSESWGLPQTADFMFTLMTSDEFAKQGLLMCKILKNRYGNVKESRRFTIGVDYDKMRLINNTWTEDAVEVVSCSNPSAKFKKTDSNNHTTWDVEQPTLEWDFSE